MVTAFLWMAQRLVSFKRATIYASATSCKASTAAEVKRLQQRTAKGCFRLDGQDKRRESTCEMTNPWIHSQISIIYGALPKVHLLRGTISAQQACGAKYRKPFAKRL
jgi:hypothetical protein